MSNTYRERLRVGLVISGLFVILAVFVLVRGPGQRPFVGRRVQDNRITDTRAFMEFKPGGAINSWLKAPSGRKSEVISFTYREVQPGHLEIRSPDSHVQQQTDRSESGSLRILTHENSNSGGSERTW
jgi:hypothetical protein